MFFNCSWSWKENLFSVSLYTCLKTEVCFRLTEIKSNFKPSWKLLELLCVIIDISSSWFRLLEILDMVVLTQVVSLSLGQCANIITTCSHIYIILLAYHDNNDKILLDVKFELLMTFYWVIYSIPKGKCMWGWTCLNAQIIILVGFIW